MKRWRALFCVVLLCGICLSGLCVPVSAADDTQMYSYNGVELPALPEWDKETYPVAIICYFSFLQKYQLRVCSEFVYQIDSDGSYDVGVLNYMSFVSSGVDSWSGSSSVSDGPLWITDVGSDYILWTNTDILYEDGTVATAASEPVPVGGTSGTMEIQSSQILDDSASFVISVSDLASTESIYSIKAVLSSAGTEVKSTVTDTFAGTSNEMHLTVANLEPETAYDISFILQKNGTDTTITASTSFTTLAGSGAGEGETPDYTGQLNEIQISVDNVGTKLDGVQETLTETKEEITSLPEKIATSITEGVKGLFIPSLDDFTDVQYKYQEMLSEKLGFIWQAFDLLMTFFSDLQTNLESGEAYEFTFPGVKVPINGEEFVFIAETPVSLENELMDVLRPVLGTIVSIVCVTVFVNMAHDYALAIISGISAYQFERRKD